ncbi:MAG: hypothetical protein HFH60_10725 [Lachnospiraceae bacterium]|nr:hypothetical protein [Lachnospiraceae bacterium]
MSIHQFRVGGSGCSHERQIQILENVCADDFAHAALWTSVSGVGGAHVNGDYS